MDRPLRIEYPHAGYQVISRGNSWNKIFISDHDGENILFVLNAVVQWCNRLCHAYRLMDNHYHLLVETPDGNLSLGMRQLNGVFTQARNKRYNKTGHHFQGGYKAILIQPVSIN